MKGHNIFVRIVALVLCAIMILGVVTAALAAFAAEPESAVLLASPDTGSQSMVWVIVAVVAALAVIIGCLVVPKMKK